MTRHATRRGYSLLEVLIAAGVLVVFMIPVLLVWITAKGGAAQDVREVVAANLASEILEQVASIRRNNGSLADIPAAGGPEDLDLETIREKDNKGWMATLFPTKWSARSSRLYLSPLPEGFRRFLKIEPAIVGGDNGFYGPQILWRVRARVIFDTPHAGKMLEKSFVLTSYIFDEKRSKSGG